MGYWRSNTTPKKTESQQLVIETISEWDGLNEWEQGFIFSLIDRDYLSKKQSDKLASLYDKYLERS